MNQRLFTETKGSIPVRKSPKETRIITISQSKAAPYGKMKKKTAKEMLERDTLERVTKGRPLFTSEQRHTLERIAYGAKAPVWIGGKYDRQPYEGTDEYYARIRKMTGLDK